MSADLCQHMTTVTLDDGRTVVMDNLAECEEALRTVEMQNEGLRDEVERLRRALRRIHDYPTGWTGSVLDVRQFIEAVLAGVRVDR